MNNELPPHIAYTQALDCDIKYNLSNSCAQALSLNELLAMAQRNDWTNEPLEYASVNGSEVLSTAIKNFHQKLNSASDLSNAKVITFSGA